MNRPTCPACNQNLCAVNYIRGDKTHYRSRCDYCIKKGRRARIPTPRWKASGYKKKPQCERCGFKLKHPEQSNVFYVDGNLKNNNWLNLRTICLNCQQEIYKNNLPWKPSPLVPDFSDLNITYQFPHC